MRVIAGLFGRSPFGPLAQHTERVQQTVQLLRPLFETFMAGEWQRTHETYKQISKLEHKADLIKNEIRDHLPRSLFLPVDRGDILLFLKEQDAIADRAEDLGVILNMRRTPTPASMREPVFELVDQVTRTVDLWHETARDLPILQEASFTGPEVDKTMERIRDISDAEWEADKIQARASALLFEHEDELGAVSVVMWMHTLEVLGGVANHAENTADLLRLMLARR